MKIAVDKNSIKAVNKENEYIYVYENETLQELLSKKMHCINYKYCPYVDINLTEYDLDCIKKAKITDKDYDKLPEKMNYKYAIIVPNYNNDHGEYNGKTFLQNCIESILNQSYDNFELIIVDDCSTDTSIKTITDYMLDTRIHLIQNSRKRYNGGSRNVGIEYALQNVDFDYFCFLDSDDWWKHNKVLEMINQRLYNHEMMTLGCEMLGKNGVTYTSKNEAKCYQDLWSLNNRLWCTAWARVIRKDKIAYFCEDTLMEDRVWTYKVADKLNYENVINLKETVYVWNRTNTTNSVSQVKNGYWDASAYCHIGHQLQMLENIRHKEMIPILMRRINECKERARNNTFQQY